LITGKKITTSSKTFDTFRGSNPSFFIISYYYFMAGLAWLTYRHRPS
jgi:hypothetical protein